LTASSGQQAEDTDHGIRIGATGEGPFRLEHTGDRLVGHDAAMLRTYWWLTLVCSATYCRYVRFVSNRSRYADIYVLVDLPSRE
jgi:hypothetical protein